MVPHSTRIRCFVWHNILESEFKFLLLFNQLPLIYSLAPENHLKVQLGVFFKRSDIEAFILRVHHGNGHAHPSTLDSHIVGISNRLSDGQKVSVINGANIVSVDASNMGFLGFHDNTQFGIIFGGLNSIRQNSLQKFLFLVETNLLTQTLHIIESISDEFFFIADEEQAGHVNSFKGSCISEVLKKLDLM